MYYSRGYRGHEQLISVNMAENPKNVATVKLISLILRLFGGLYGSTNDPQIGMQMILDWK